MDKEREQRVHPIEELMKTAMASIKQMVDVNTVVGDAVKTDDGTVIIPVSQVACGFASGGAEYDFHNHRGAEMPFGGGSGAGVSVKPVGFLVCKINDVRLISVRGNHLAERIVDLAPQIIDKIEYMLQGFGRKNAEESGTNQ
ncbi:MAG: GerW family sporulation protein [Syntrophomonadaceae bacterium]|nr:GerW family sporulation protein [Syntrophomonadaceae bacterium]